MRPILVVWALGLSGCVLHPAIEEPRGQTLRMHTGGVSVVFTNATPAKMCGLYMSYEDQSDYGDNWLPEEGVASGQSVSFNVKQGKYKARWDTCTSGRGKPFYAGTLWREMGFNVQRETQLYAFVADTVAPTKRAAVMTRDHHIVHFQGQMIGGPDWNKPATHIASAKSQQTVIAASEAMPQHVDLSQYCERPRHAVKKPPVAKKKGAKKNARVGIRTPTLKRAHDIVDAKVRYRTR